jgi:glucose/arabinose dehydrogenase
VLIEDFCQQYPSHSVGSLAFGSDGALYVSAGDGASFNFADYGQDGNPLNPCGDPPAGAGGTMTPPTAEGGALRSQDIRTTADATGLDGAILRVDPDTGAAMAGNPNIGSADANTRRIVAHGLRNPFRITVRPGTSEVWAGDVGWNTWEEINRVQSPTGGTTNFGWPCYEGAGRLSAYDNLNLNVCENLYSAGSSAWAPPYFTYNHSAKVVTGETCPTGGSSISGLAFYTGGTFGPAYEGALFFSDYSRRCIWVMFAGANGLPDPATRQTFIAGAAGPVELQIGPEGDLYYVDMPGGTIRRVRGPNTNRTPTAVATASPASGAVPLTVDFDGRDSSDPDDDTLTYAWDLDGDGAFDDSTSATPSRTYSSPGTVAVGLRVTDTGGLTDSDTVSVTAGTPPDATITSPAAGTTWRVGDTIAFAGTATDSGGQALPASALTWQVNLQHCNRQSTGCHTHVLQSLTGASGSIVAPDHEYPSHLELQLTARDASGLTRTVTRPLDPQTVALTLQSSPPGADLTLGSEVAAAPFTRDVILGSRNGVTASSPIELAGVPLAFASWSDGGAATHEIVANETATYTATYTQSVPVKLAGSDVVGANTSEAAPGRAEVYRTVASTSGLATHLRVRLAATSASSAVVLGLYADSGGQPTTLLASGRLNAPQAGAFNEVSVAGVSLSAGTAYWISILNPLDATGTLRWLDRAGGTGGAEQTSAAQNLGVLPAAWATGSIWSDGPISGYVWGTPAAPPPPALAVSPASLSFSGTAGAASPAAKTLSVLNDGSGTFPFTASDDATWLAVTPSSGTAPRDVSVAVDTAGLAAGTYTATVRVESAGVNGSPKLVPVTLVVSPAAQPPALGVTPASLAFDATAGGASPAAKSVSVTNTGGGTLAFTTSDNASWLAVSPASGTAPASLSVSVNVTGLAAGTYNGAVTVTASGAAGSPATIPVTLTVGPSTPPPPALVGAWGFDEASGGTATDASGRGNAGTLSGPVRTTGRYGGGLSFDGVNDWVTVADASSLDLTTGMTLEAWVRPAALGSAWRTVVLKEQAGQLAYGLYAGTDTGSRPAAHVFTSRDIGLLGPSALPLSTWSHLAMTWDGLTVRVYVNGTQVSSSALAGTAVTSGSPLRIGGNSVWPEWFSGVIDEVRVYSRALNAAEIATDRDTAVGGAGAALASVKRAARANAKKARAKAKKVRRAKRKAVPRKTQKRVHRSTRWLNR